MSEEKEVLKAVGEAMRATRMKHQLTLRKYCQLIGVPAGYVSRIERGGIEDFNPLDADFITTKECLGEYYGKDE